jgi:general secretion pathway protein G
MHVLRCRRGQRGFTLIELLVVISILAIIAVVVAPQFLGKADDAKVDAAKIQIDKISTAIELYRLENGKYPPDLNALYTAPTNAPHWKGPYLKKQSMLKDPWENDMIYRQPGEHGPYDVLSYGSDGQSGGEGHGADIGNWQ